MKISIYNLNPHETFDFQNLRLRFVNPGNFNLQILRFQVIEFQFMNFIFNLQTLRFQFTKPRI